MAGGELLGGGSVGFGVGNLGEGGGSGGASSTDCVGDGKGGFLRVLELSLALSLTFGSTPVAALGLATGEGDAALLAFRLVTPPAGIPDSA